MSLRILIAGPAEAMAEPLAESVRATFPHTIVELAPLRIGDESLMPREGYDSIICRAKDLADLEWVRQVRSSGNVTPILAVSADESPTFRDQAMISGATKFVLAARGFNAIFEHLTLVEKLTKAQAVLSAEMARAKQLCGEVGDLLLRNKESREAQEKLQPPAGSEDSSKEEVQGHVPVPERKLLDCQPLIVDDDPDFTFLLKKCLIAAEVLQENVRSSGDGHAALELLANGEWTPSLILLDHKMPKLDGLEVLKWIRSRESFKAIPIFLISTGWEPELVKETLLAGAEAHYTKPLGYHELQQNVRNILAYWKAGVRSAHRWQQ